MPAVNFPILRHKDIPRSCICVFLMVLLCGTLGRASLWEMVKSRGVKSGGVKSARDRGLGFAATWSSASVHVPCLHCHADMTEGG
jgi:hypothetical protein